MQLLFLDYCNILYILFYCQLTRNIFHLVSQHSSFLSFYVHVYIVYVFEYGCEIANLRTSVCITMLSLSLCRITGTRQFQINAEMLIATTRALTEQLKHIKTPALSLKFSGDRSLEVFYFTFEYNLNKNFISLNFLKILISCDTRKVVTFLCFTTVTFGPRDLLLKTKYYIFQRRSNRNYDVRLRC